MGIKKCKTCGIEKELNLDNFYFNGGYWCKECKLCRINYQTQYYQSHKEEKLQYQAEYQQNHQEEIKEYQIEYYQDNKEYILQYQAEYQQNHKVEIKKYKKEYHQTNKEEIKKNNAEYKAKPENKKRRNANDRLKRKNDPNFKLRQGVSNSINRSLKKRSSSKNGKSIIDYLPYTIEELKAYLENLFEPWMTWQNHGDYDIKTWDDNNDTTKTWQIDHIIPQSSFHYTSMEDQAFKDCWALSNLRPLSAKTNLLKRDKLEGEY